MFQSFDTPPPATATAPRIAALRRLMAERGFDAYLVPRADEHQNEYVPANAERLAFLTGFTGSAGLAVIAARKAALFVDGRYTIQAPAEVDTGLIAVKGVRSTDLLPWLTATLPSGGAIGFDPRLHTVAEIEALKGQLRGSGLVLRPAVRNLVERVWGRERPAAPQGPVSVHPVAAAGRESADKIAAVQKILKEARHDAVLISATDSICWLFNIRGADVAHNPVVLAHAIVPASGKPELFIAPAKVTGEAKTALAGRAKVRPPEDLAAALAALKKSGKAVRISPAASWWAFGLLGGAKRVKRAADPCVEPKAIKTSAELAGAREAHLRDGAAVVRFLAWLDGAVAGGPVDEITAVCKLEEFRRETQLLKEISFPTISGSGPNGAIVHYRVTGASNRTLKTGELFLIDSGGQYADGTTDITRTVAIGPPSAEMKTRFTLVLKGMIAVSSVRFPRGTRGIDLDPFARRALWQAGLNYDHGTGHGVGSYLNVHEGPQSISKAGMAELKPGMICSNEPGYYKTGAYGIRIENLIVVGEPQDVGGDHPVMGFETLTLVPIDQRLIDVGLLGGEEKSWIDAYHRRVADLIGPLVEGSTRRWLMAATAKLKSQ